MMSWKGGGDGFLGSILGAFWYLLCENSAAFVTKLEDVEGQV